MGVRGGKVLRTASAAARKFHQKQMSASSSQVPTQISPTSGVGKFLGIPDSPRSDVDILLSKYIRLSQNRLTKKGEYSEEKLKKMFSGGGEEKMVGINETMKLLEGRGNMGGFSKAAGSVRSKKK